MSTKGGTSPKGENEYSGDENGIDKGNKYRRYRRYVVCLMLKEEVEDVLVIVDRADVCYPYYDSRKIAQVRANLLNYEYPDEGYHIREVHPTGILSEPIV